MEAELIIQEAKSLCNKTFKTCINSQTVDFYTISLLLSVQANQRHPRVMNWNHTLSPPIKKKTTKNIPFTLYTVPMILQINPMQDAGIILKYVFPHTKESILLLGQDLQVKVKSTKK